MQQNALGRIDDKPGEQLGIAQRQLHHLAQLPDGITHAADIVVVSVSAAATGLFEFLAQLYLGMLVDVDDALGHGRNHRQAYLGKGIGRSVEHPRDLRRHVMDLLLAGGGNIVPRHQRALEEIAAQRLGGAVQAHFLLRGCKNHAGGSARFGLADSHVIT